MKGLIFYRILTLLLNIFCSIIGMSLILMLLVVFSNPANALGFFIALSVLLYAWHANRFMLIVLIRKETTTKKHKDWIQVNAIVAFIFSILCIVQGIMIINNPNVFAEEFKQMSPAPYSPKIFMKMAIGILVFAGVLLTHLVYTYVLIRKNKDAFLEEEQLH